MLAIIILDISGECENTFNVYKYESSADTATDFTPEWKDSRLGYRKLKTIAAQVIERTCWDYLVRY